MVTTSQEQEEVAVNAVTVSERLSVIEANQRSILGEMRENARRQDQNYRDLSTKIDTSETKLEAKINALDAKFDTSETKLEAKIDTSETKLEAKINALDAKFDTKFDRLYFAIFATGAGVIVTLIGGIVTLVITQ